MAGNARGGGPTFQLSAAATLAMVAGPALTLVLVHMLFGQPGFLMDASVACSISIGVSLFGTRAWARHSGTTAARFGELMLWSWWKRRRFDARIKVEVDRLDLSTPAAISPEDRLHSLRDINRALEYKDAYTRGHARRVERHVFRTATAMSLPTVRVADATEAASLHDVGKIEVPLRIIHKDGPLSRKERLKMERHPAVGAKMLQGVVNPQVIASVSHHHERWD